LRISSTLSGGDPCGISDNKLSKCIPPKGGIFSMNTSKLAETILLVKPDHFGFNNETAGSNSFMKPMKNRSKSQVREKALDEFALMVRTLTSSDINVLVMKSREDRVTPDSVFPNNWFSTHPDGSIVLYPMLAYNRRDERQPDKLKQLLSDSGFEVNTCMDWSHHEKEGLILEGTGSIVFSKDYKVAFAMASPRTDEKLFKKYCLYFGYEPVFFHAYDSFSKPVYHTNVIMAVGDGFAVLCSESIKDQTERTSVHSAIKKLGLERIDITLEQVSKFCGNIIQLNSKSKRKKIVLSSNAFEGFTDLQKRRLEQYGSLVEVDIRTIEHVGGGSARCMIAEIFLPKN